jgi:hypothetical protein
VSDAGSQDLSESTRAFLSVVHPAHLEYIRKTPINTLSYFFEVIGTLDSEEHADIIRHLFFYSLPQFGFDSQSQTFKMPEVTRESVNAFSARCRQASMVIGESALIIGLIVGTLSELFGLADTSSVDETKNRLMRMVERSMRGELGDLESLPDDTVGWIVNHMEHLPEKAEKARWIYIYFCENVLQKLLAQ